MISNTVAIWLPAGFQQNIKMQNPPSCPRILVVEDETKLVRSLVQGLEEDGYVVATASDGMVAQQKLRDELYDVVILDWMLPEVSGIELLQEFRRTGNRTPVLLLTAKDSVSNRVEGLDAGADDYLVKPFAFEELLARLRALLRRPTSVGALRVGSLELDAVGRVASRSGRTLDLSTREFALLEYLMRQAETTVSRDALSRDVWQDPEPGLTNVVDVYIAYLRKKLESDGGSRMIHTVRGQGYVLRGDV